MIYNQGQARVARVVYGVEDEFEFLGPRTFGSAPLDCIYQILFENNLVVTNFIIAHGYLKVPAIASTST